MNRVGGGLPSQAMEAPGVTVAHMGLGDIPTLSTALNALGVIVLEDTAGGLSEEQGHALIAWVVRGGTLIVAPRPGGSQVPAQLLDLLPVKIEGTRTLTGLKGLADMVAVPPPVSSGAIAATGASLRSEPSVGARAL